MFAPYKELHNFYHLLEQISSAMIFAPSYHVVARFTLCILSSREYDVWNKHGWKLINRICSCCFPIIKFVSIGPFTALRCGTLGLQLCNNKPLCSSYDAEAIYSIIQNYAVTIVV